MFFFFFFFNDTATTEIYTLSLHDALPIKHLVEHRVGQAFDFGDTITDFAHEAHVLLDRKSTRLNSSHVKISYAVFCLKKKKKKKKTISLKKKKNTKNQTNKKKNKK